MTQQLVADLQQEADLRDLAEREVIEAAIDTLSAGRTSAHLAAINWPDFLSNRAISSTTERCASYIEHVRDVLFVVPVAFVWIELRQAFQALDTSAQAPTFLSQWQTGFEGQSRTFGSVALLVFLGLGLIVALSLTSSALRIVADTQDTKRTRLLSALGYRTQVALIGSGGADVSSAAAEVLSRVENPISELCEAVEILQSQLDPMVRAIVDQSDRGDKLTISTNEITSQVQTIARYVNDLTTASKRLTAQSDAQLDETTKLIEAAADAAKRIERSIDAAVQHGQSLESAADDLTTAATERVERSIDAAVQHGQSLESAASDLTAATRHLTTAAELAARTFANLQIQIDQLDGRSP